MPGRNRILIRLAIAAAVAMLCGCQDRQPPPPLVAPVTGTVSIAGLTAPVRVVRDAWGVPHIYAQNTADLFVAQGFVQASDRLFQMDLWKRAAEGRLSQVLGANFVDRDAMTRRIQYRGDPAAEWASYGPDAKPIVEAFVRGINAWVALARERPPETFLLAGWKPEYWKATDVLTRTDAFLASAGALESIARQHLGEVVVDQVRSIGAAPFFAGLAAPVRIGASRLPPPPAPGAAATTTTAPAGRTAASREGVTVSEAAKSFEIPSARYFVHLHAPGWNVIGATRPWLPGVAVGHNARIAWGAEPIALDTEALSVIRDTERLARTVVHDAILIKGRRSPFVYDTVITPRGVVIASDSERQRSFALRWSGTEAGAAAELGALALDRADDWDSFRSALTRWRMPVRRIVYADVDGNVGVQVAGLVPVTRGDAWAGWRSLDDLPHAFNPRGRTIAASSSAAAASDAASAVFVHTLAISGPARQRLDVGPIARPADDSVVRGAFEAGDWDRSRAMNAPGQSEAVDSPHYRDLAALWSKNQSMRLVFSDAAVQQFARGTLVLTPYLTR
jgi:penicillin amidase